jgi:small conductance mechanosensitive channel
MDITRADLEQFAHEHLFPLGMKLIVAIVIFVVGRQIAKLVLRGMDRMMERSRFDVSLRKFLRDIVNAILLISIIIAALDAIGVETTAVVAVLGGMALAIGLALQGSLSNFAAGVMLIVLRPYKVGDLVTIGKYLGKVDAIRVFQTILVTLDHREVTIPNGQIIAQPIENLSALGRRRVDLVVSVLSATQAVTTPAGTPPPAPVVITPANIAQVRSLLEGVIAADPRIQQSPSPTIDVLEVADTGVKITFRPWTSPENYTKVASDMMERIKAALEGAQLKFTVSIQVAP